MFPEIHDTDIFRTRIFNIAGSWTIRLLTTGPFVQLVDMDDNFGSGSDTRGGGIPNVHGVLQA
jgi:hypothetical protein